MPEFRPPAGGSGIGGTGGGRQECSCISVVAEGPSLPLPGFRDAAEDKQRPPAQPASAREWRCDRGQAEAPSPACLCLGVEV